MPTISPDVYLSMGLTREEYDLILGLLGREPSMTELGMFSVQWSEHCSYKCSRNVLAYFKRYKEAIEGEGLENAGIVDIGDGLGVVMKVESHNHPSAVEPYQGAATGVGGIIRDIFTMGARPIAALNSLRFGPIVAGQAPVETVDRNHYLFKRVVAGIGGYGNCVGVPTVGGEVAFHPRYSGNPLVNAMCVGLVRLDGVATAGANGIGNPVVYLGSSTGKDGIHGASFASEGLGDDSEAKRPNVQIGDPFAEKLLIEATLEALKTGAVQSIQDMGAAGLTCSTTEMSSKGGVGMDIDLDLVPMREDDMSAYELMLSESQERMLCVAHSGREQEIMDVFSKWGVQAVVIGHVTEGPNVRVWRHGKLEVDAPAEVFTDGCPAYDLPTEEPDTYRTSATWSPDSLPRMDPNKALIGLLACPTLASKRWVYRQYDQQVQTQTVLTPGRGDAAVLAPRGTKRGLAVTIDGNARWVAQDPYIGGQLAVAEAARNVACTGARPRAATDGLNYGNPKSPRVYWQFERSVKGIADACEALETPVVSGNVSFYNESELGEVLPTPLIGMLGVLEDASKRVGQSFSEPGLEVWAITYDRPVSEQDGLGASSYAFELFGVEDGRPESPVLGLEMTLCEYLVSLAEGGLVDSMHDVSDGGVLVALAEMSLEHQVGLDCDLSPVGLGRSTTGILFGEFPGLVFVALRPDASGLSELDVPAGLRASRVGTTTERAALVTALDGNRVVEVEVRDLSRVYESAIPGLMEGG